MAITHAQLFSIPVSDQDRARDFYVKILGFDLLQDTQMDPDSRWVQVRPKDAQTSMALVTWFESMPAGSMRGLVLETAQLDQDVEALRAKGLAVGELHDEPWGRFVTFEDPDGNGIILQETAGA